MQTGLIGLGCQRVLLMGKMRIAFRFLLEGHRHGICQRHDRPYGRLGRVVRHPKVVVIIVINNAIVGSNVGDVVGTVGVVFNSGAFFFVVSQ